MVNPTNKIATNQLRASRKNELLPVAKGDNLAQTNISAVYRFYLSSSRPFSVALLRTPGESLIAQACFEALLFSLPTPSPTSSREYFSFLLLKNRKSLAGSSKEQQLEAGQAC